MNNSHERATIVSLLLARVARDADLPALGVKRQGVYHWITWQEVLERAWGWATRLKSLGLQHGDRLILVSENRAEWIFLDLAVHLARGMHVAVHASLSGQQIAWQIRDSGARLVVLSTPEQAAKLAAVADLLPPGLQYFSFDPVGEITIGPALIGLLTPGEPAAAIPPTDEQPVAADLATILYTSGTTGEPKGVMLTHGNLASNALAAQQAVALPADELRLGWLPLSHIFARTSDLYYWLAGGPRLALAESRETLLADCQAVHPSFINGVPYFYEKVARHLQETGRGDQPGALVSLLGGKMRACCSGGAALPNHVAEYFASQNVLLFQGYGLTETSPVITTGTPTDHRLGTVGRPVAGVEVRIADDGEILTRGPHVMRGYWNNPQATAEVLDPDGWFYTGDLGVLEDGYLRITGRKKELIVTAAGKNIAPVYLESLLAADPLVAQAMIVGEGRSYLAALIVPNPDPLRAEIIRRRIPVASPAEALAHPAVREIYAQLIAQRLACVSHHEQVRAFRLLGRAFAVENDELTPTLKLRRAVIQQHFAAEIADMYVQG